MENFDRPKRTTHACARVSLSKKTKIDEDSPDASRVPENSLEVDSQLICDQTDFNIIVIENKSTDESSGKGHGVPQSTARTQSRQQADQLHEGLVGSRSIRHTDASQQRDGGMPQSARKKGRPKGAKNKEKGRALKDATSIEVGTGMGVEDRDIDTSTCLPPVAVAGKGSASKRGRPKGTKNKNSKRGQTISTNTSTSKDTRVQHSTHASMATDEGTTVTVQRELPECMKRLAVLYQSIDLGCAFLRIGGRVLSFKNVMAVAAANCGITPTHVDLARLCAIAPKLIKVYHNAYELEDIFKLEAMKEPYRLDTRTEGQKRADETAALASEGFFREKGAAADDQGTSLPPPSVVRKSDSIIEMIGKGSKGRKMPTPRMLTDRRIAFELRVQLWLAKFGTLDDTATVYEEALFATVNYEHFESEPSTRSTTPPDCSREALDRNIFGDGDGETSAEFLAHLKSLPFYHGQIAHVEHIPARAAKFSETDIDEDPNIGWSVADAVKCVSKIERLYTHQAHAIAHSSAGNHVVLCTSTSSGKSLAYNIPVLQAIVDDPTTMALYLFPTKALAQDQQRALKKLTAHDTLCNRVKVATFDGDTDRETRSVVRESANIILSNPDMIHASILPYHDQWSHFLSRLKFVVVDEAHIYRGQFGSHVAMVFRRLLRMCAHYGADPQWIMCTATIANPREHSLRLIPLDVPDEPEHKQADTDTHPESTLRAEDSAEMGVDQPETVQRGTDMDCTELSEDGTSIQPPDNPRQTSSTPQTRPTTSTDRYIDTPHVTHTDTDGQISVDTQVQAPERNERISTNTQTQAPETLKQVPTSTHTQAPDRPSVDMRRRLVVVGEDGSPNGRKDYVLWNPAAFSSVYTEAGVLLCEMAKTGLRTIGFCKVRSVCELVCKVTQSMMREGTSVTTLGGNRHKTKGSDCSGLPAPRPDLVPYITTYRGGYTAMDRRKIERDLFGGRLLSVIATNALELGIDVGSLDSVLQLGYPGSIASLWQQAGRAGRSGKQSIAVLIGYNSPLDQHFMKNPKALFSKASEAVVFDPFNNRVLWWHLLCAATELPLCAGTKNYDARLFGDKYGTLIQDMVRGMAVDGSYNAAHGAVIRAANNNYHTTSHAIDFPHGKTSLRNIYTENYRVLDADTEHELDNIEERRAHFELYDGAVYLHRGESYVMEDVDHKDRVAYARKSDVNYHTAVNDQTLLVDYTVRRHLTGGPKAHPYTGAYGSVRVVTNVFGYKKILNKTRTIIESITSEIPDFEMITESLWIDIGLEFKNGLAEISLDYRGGLHACNHLLVNVLGFYLLCDRGDVQPVCYSEQETKNRPLCINIYDSVEGGTGISEAAYHKIEPIMQKAYELIKGCDCEEANGCPACTHDPSCGEYNNCLDKKAALWILERLVARTPTS